MHWTLIMLRGAVAPVLTLLLGFAVSRFLWALSAIGPQGPSELGVWAVRSADAAFAVALGMLGLFFWRLYAWERGTAPACMVCGGPLGRLRDGKVYYGKQLADYRKCYNCGTPNAAAGDPR